MLPAIIIPLLFSFSLTSNTSTDVVGYPYKVHATMDCVAPSAPVWTDDDHLITTTLEVEIGCDIYAAQDYTYELHDFSFSFVLNYTDGLNVTNSLTFNYQDHTTFTEVDQLYQYYSINTFAESDYYYVDLYCGNQNPLDYYTDFGFSSFLAWGETTVYFDNSQLVDNIRTYLYTLFTDVSAYYDSGYNTGYSDGVADGTYDGYQTGYSDGIQEASTQDQTALTIFTGICEVGLLPVNVFLGILNFEVFGINIGGFVASLMTVAIVVIVVRIFIGGNKQND